MDLWNYHQMGGVLDAFHFSLKIREAVQKVWAVSNFVDFVRTSIQKTYSNILFSEGMSDF